MNRNDGLSRTAAAHFQGWNKIQRILYHADLQSLQIPLAQSRWSPPVKKEHTLQLSTGTIEFQSITQIEGISRFFEAFAQNTTTYVKCRQRGVGGQSAGQTGSRLCSSR
jgi:hypothetical protein